MMAAQPRAYDIVALPGDGVGPEVTDAALAVLREVCDRRGIAIRVEVRLVGGAAIASESAPISTETFARCEGADAVLFGATGGPQWDHLTGDARPGSALVRLRRRLNLFVNLRPVRVHVGLEERTTLRPEVVAGTDIMVVRELAGGIYYGPRGRSGAGPEEAAFDTMAYTRAEVERVAHAAFRLAAARRGRLVSVDKANVLTTSRLWREVVTDVARGYPGVELTHALVDSFALRLVQHPRDLDVILTENLFGDILSDEAAALSGSIGLLPSASLSPGGRTAQGPGDTATTGEAEPWGRPAMYEPIHGSAPDIAGRNLANPVGAILSAAMMLELSLGNAQAAAHVRAAVDSVIAAGVLTADLGGQATTAEVTRAIVDHLP